MPASHRSDRDSSPDLAPILGARFLARSDAWVEQGAHGRYRARRGRLDEGLVRRHLDGTLSLHAYALAPPGPAPLLQADSCLWGAFDIDAADGAAMKAREIACALARALVAIAGEGPVLLEKTGGRGLHVWLLLGERAPARAVVSLMDQVLSRAGLEPSARVQAVEGVVVERYPKQEALRGGVGSSLRLPLGVHPATGRRSVFFDTAVSEVRDPTCALTDSASWCLRGGALARALPVQSRWKPVVKPRKQGLGQPGLPTSSARPVAPDAWATYRWAVERLGLSGRTKHPPRPGARRHSVRCLFPERHAHDDRSGEGSAYLILDGEAQLYGCAVCLSGGAIDTLSLIAEVEPSPAFRSVLKRAHELDAVRFRTTALPQK